MDGVPSNCEARSVPLAPPQHLSRAPGPVVAISYLHTFLRHGGGVGPREGPHCALSGPLPGRARRSGRAGQGAGPPGRLRPSFPALRFAFVWERGVDGERWLRPGSASALAPQTQAGAPDLHPAAERAELGRGKRRGLCSRSHVPTLRGVRVFTSLVGAGPHLKAAASLGAPAYSRSPVHCSVPSLPRESGANEDLDPCLALSVLPGCVSSEPQFTCL